VWTTSGELARSRDNPETGCQNPEISKGLLLHQGQQRAVCDTGNLSEEVDRRDQHHIGTGLEAVLPWIAARTRSLANISYVLQRGRRLDDQCAVAVLKRGSIGNGQSRHYL